MLAGLAGLALDRAPPLGVPLRFLLTAPAFGVAAGIALVAAGPGAPVARLAGSVVGATHLFTLGVVTMVMCGALFQLLAVVGGGSVPRQRQVAAVTHALLTGGAAVLAAGLILERQPAVGVGALLALAALMAFAAAAGAGVRTAARGQETVRAMGLALAALAVAAALGATAALARAGWPAPRLPLAGHLHQGWVLAGWVGVLVMGVAWQVVPMFQMTPPYPAWARRWLPRAVMGALAVWSAAAPAALPGAALALLPAGLALGAFAVLTLRLQTQRRRRLPDATLSAWRLAMISLLGALACAAPAFMPGADPRWAYAAGTLYLAGFAASAIVGMLYKIVPFLLWLDLHRRLQPVPGALGRVPHLRQLLPETRARRQLRLQAAAVLLLALSVLWPRLLLLPAGLALAAAWAVMGAVMLGAVRAHRAALGRAVP